ncbi:MAG: hypothetical protein WBE76_06015 [Terracidiphilus sp.]
MAILFLALAGIFLVASGPLRSQWFAAPGFMTLLASVEFAIVPFYLFATNQDQIDAGYLRTMVYLLVGFSAFWLACWFLRKPHLFIFSPQSHLTHPRVLGAAALLLLIGGAAKTILWRLGLIGYELATMQYSADVSLVGAFSAASQALQMAMVILAIEILGKRAPSYATRLLFVVSLVLCLGFGLVWGLKVDLLMPIFSLVALLGIVRGRLPRLAWALPAFYLIMQPFMNAYRSNLNSGYATQIGTADGLISVLGKSFEDAISGSRNSRGSHNASAFQTASERLSALALFHNVIELPSPDLLNGEEKVWMAPFYPFIPRPLWKGKPVFDKGHRMSEALGIGTANSENIPAIADMYALGGVWAIPAGMFLWGAILQTYMNRIKGGLSERGLFFYLTTLIPITTVSERDVVALIGSAVETGCIVLFLSWLVYGGPLFSLSRGSREISGQRGASCTPTKRFEKF